MNARVGYCNREMREAWRLPHDIAELVERWTVVVNGTISIGCRFGSVRETMPVTFYFWRETNHVIVIPWKTGALFISVHLLSSLAIS